MSSMIIDGLKFFGFVQADVVKDRNVEGRGVVVYLPVVGD